MIVFILNSPYTFLGLILGLLSIPESIQFRKKPYAIVINVKSLWWNFMKGSRAKTCGSVVLLTPRSEGRDLEHELIHVKQGDKFPIIFPFLYYYELLKKGYRANKYEEEAYLLSGGTYRDK